MRTKFFVGFVALVALCCLLTFAQDAGRRRESGIVFTRGCFVEITAGGTVSAGDALYLDSAGKVQRLTSAQDVNVVGVADQAGVLNDTIRMQFCGKVEVTANAAVTIGDRVGGTSTGTAGRVRTLSDTLVVDSGGTTVTSSAANGNIITGDPIGSRILGRALKAAAADGDKIDVLLTLQ